MLTDTADAILFELSCKMAKPNFSLQDAIAAAERYVADDRKLSKDQLLGCLMYNYATAAPPTTRQHIYRMACQFCPHDRAVLEAKLDGASDAQLLDVLAGLEKRYCLDIGEDSKIDQLQMLLRANSALLLENVELRDQVALMENGRGLSVIRKAHEEVIDKLYTCIGQLERVNEERKELLQRNASLESQIEQLISIHKSSQLVEGPDGERAPTRGDSINVEAIAWKARCDALQSRIEQMNTTHMTELAEVSAENRKLRREADTAHILLASQSSRASQLERALENERLAKNTAGGNASRFMSSVTREAACQTAVTGHALSSTTLGISCSGCDSLTQQVADLRQKLSVAVEAMLAR